VSSLVIRRERPEDAVAISAVQGAAFGTEGAGEPVEVRLVEALRRSDGWLPRLSLVAEDAGAVVAHSICSQGRLDVADGPPVACLGLGPIGVMPERQGTGVGSALMWAMIGAADATDAPLIALLGSPDYYRRFGFIASSEVGIEPPDAAWGQFFQVLTLSSWQPSMTGRFVYASPFDDLN